MSARAGSPSLSSGGLFLLRVCGAEQVFESIKHAHESARRCGATATGSRPSRQGCPSMTITQMRRSVTYCIVTQMRRSVTSLRPARESPRAPARPYGQSPPEIPRRSNDWQTCDFATREVIACRTPAAPGTPQRPRRGPGSARALRSLSPGRGRLRGSAPGWAALRGRPEPPPPAACRLRRDMTSRSAPWYI